MRCSELERSIYEKEVERTTELSAVRTRWWVERAAIQQRDEERNRILHAVLPERIAERMIAGETHIADHIESVTILLADIVGFTNLASTMEPEALVAMLEELFTAFDNVAARMEQHSQPGRILCSQTAAEALRKRPDLRFEQREPLDIPVCGSRGFGP
ncbi:hypothetical protein BH10BAC6_BH10BAC6_06690 [soil metagenome]